MKRLKTLVPQVFPGGNPWYFGEPNGDTHENCGVIWPYRKAWNDADCNTGGCGFCDFKVYPDLHLRGNIRGLSRA